MRLFFILLHKEKHVGTLFFHIFVIILAERVIQLCIFSFPIKPATKVWIGFMKKRGKFPYFGLYSPWSCAPGPSETGSSVIPFPPASNFCRYVHINPIRIKGVRVEADYAHHITTQPPDFQIFLRHCSLII